MDVHSTLGTLFVIAVVAVLAPVCLALLPGPRIPQVVAVVLRRPPIVSDAPVP